jgi:hypothetical protein
MKILLSERKASFSGSSRSSPVETANHPQIPPTRQKIWLKVKCALRQEFIIIGYSAAKTGDRALGALISAIRRRGRLFMPEKSAPVSQ